MKGDICRIDCQVEIWINLRRLLAIFKIVRVSHESFANLILSTTISRDSVELFEFVAIESSMRNKLQGASFTLPQFYKIHFEVFLVPVIHFFPFRPDCSEFVDSLGASQACTSMYARRQRQAKQVRYFLG